MSMCKPLNILDETTNDIVEHHYRDLITLFDTTFYALYNTLLIKGADEPIYIPSSADCHYNQIVFAHGYFASALHEISHWCLAGSSRRLLEDYGYWYIPDGRDHQQQAQFESVEIKPQAIEWALCVASGKNFDVSTDNLLGEGETDRVAFKALVYKQVLTYLANGFPKDAETFMAVLAKYYQTAWPLVTEHFQFKIN